MTLHQLAMTALPPGRLELKIMFASLHHQLSNWTIWSILLVQQSMTALRVQHYFPLCPLFDAVRMQHKWEFSQDSDVKYWFDNNFGFSPQPFLCRLLDSEQNKCKRQWFDTPFDIQRSWIVWKHVCSIKRQIAIKLYIMLPTICTKCYATFIFPKYSVSSSTASYIINQSLCLPPISSKSHSKHDSPAEDLVGMMIIEIGTEPFPATRALFPVRCLRHEEVPCLPSIYWLDFVYSCSHWSKHVNDQKVQTRFKTYFSTKKPGFTSFWKVWIKSCIKYSTTEATQC